MCVVGWPRYRRVFVMLVGYVLLNEIEPMSRERDTIQIRYNTVYYDPIRSDTIRYDTIRYDPIQYGMIRYDPIQYGMIQYDTVFIRPQDPSHFQFVKPSFREEAKRQGKNSCFFGLFFGVVLFREELLYTYMYNCT